MPSTVQCRKRSASGSSTTSAIWRVAAGGSKKVSGGETPAPEQVKRFGIVAPLLNAALAIPTAGAACGSGFEGLSPPPAAAAGGNRGHDEHDRGLHTPPLRRCTTTHVATAAAPSAIAIPRPARATSSAAASPP